MQRKLASSATRTSGARISLRLSPMAALRSASQLSVSVGLMLHMRTPRLRQVRKGLEAVVHPQLAQRPFLPREVCLAGQPAEVMKEPAFANGRFRKAGQTRPAAPPQGGFEPKAVACFVRMARIEMGQRSVGAPSVQGSARDFCPMGFLHEMTGGRQHHGSPLQTEDLVHPFH